MTNDKLQAIADGYDATANIAALLGEVARRQQMYEGAVEHRRAFRNVVILLRAEVKQLCVQLSAQQAELQAARAYIEHQHKIDGETALAYGVWQAESDRLYNVYDAARAANERKG